MAPCWSRLYSARGLRGRNQVAVAVSEASVDLDVIARHARRIKALLKRSPARVSI
jgi:hypothetical protein